MRRQYYDSYYLELKIISEMNRTKLGSVRIILIAGGISIPVKRISVILIIKYNVSNVISVRWNYLTLLLEIKLCLSYLILLINLTPQWSMKKYRKVPYLYFLTYCCLFTYLRHE